MRVLGITFSGDEASVALLDHERLVEAKLMRNSGGGTPGSMVAEVLQAAGMAAAPQAVAVALGPGSYTGIRMAVSFAKTFALVRGLPLYAWSDHAVLAVLQGGVDEDLCVLHGGHGARVYCSQWRTTDLLPTLLQEAQLCAPESFLVAADVRRIGDRSGSPCAWPTAADFARLAARAAAAGIEATQLLGVEPLLPA
ncbi:MAG: tRNA (adenosine(37)-N6)-threonylcarbamoyltransferase complex dimerization subunit type 1 TsaB [Planctomycetes bacterium]|nr:tRNA (adenosine(37)-N6)-threonylcarbamoyltransferase complex dimerization subunit type 1 TsaB [Planctomycetota bacterium]